MGRSKSSGGAVGRWRNRIVDHGLEDPEQLLANPGNWRIHPKAQQDALAGAIGDVGFIRSVTVNRLTGHVVDGHLRVQLALRNGEKQIPVEYVELSETEEAEALATLDPLGAMAAADQQKLDELLRDVQSDDAAVQAMLGELYADANASALQDATGNDGENLARGLSSPDVIRLVIALPDVATVEAALAATELNNRAEALAAVCRGYLDAKGQ